jgi:putative ABC transport system ATP-binding protein
MSTIIELKDATKLYRGEGAETAALRGVSLQVTQGESLAIIGKSGSGKSTLMHILATLDRPTDGELLVDGKPTSALNEKDLDRLRNQTFGFVFQQFFLNPRDNCLENVVLPLVIRGVAPAEREQRGQAMLEAVGLGDKAKQKANDLSGGQKQRLCIARALIGEPQVIFADEPTGNLDSENGAIVVELLFKMQREKGITLIMVTHDHDLAAMCGRSITIKDGQIIGSNA